MVNERIDYTVNSAEMKMKRVEEELPLGALGELHLHPELEFILVTSGSFVFYVEQRSYRLYAGDVFVINDRVPHYGEVTAENSSFDMVQFSVSNDEENERQQIFRFFSEDVWTCLRFPSESPEALLLREAMQRLFSVSYRQQKALACSAIACKYALLAFLYEHEHLSDVGERFSSDKTGIALRILGYVNEHYAEDLTLSSIAEHVHMSKNYVCRLFKRVTGRTVIDCLNFVRVSEAERLLRLGHSVTEAAEMTGFDCPSYFGKVFKKYLFFTPTEYKRRIGTPSEML